MPAQRNTNARKAGLAERAAQRKHERALKGGAVLAHNCERGQLIAWFAKQETQSLREFKHAIEAARMQREKRNKRVARRNYLNSKKQAERNLAQ
jgi:hypothetical protein